MTQPLRRSVWLEQLGFKQGYDPFATTSVTAEGDNLFTEPEMMVAAYVMPPKYDGLRGTPPLYPTESYTYIFGDPGSGKSSLVKRIEADFNGGYVEDDDAKERIYALVYNTHDSYQANSVSEHAHRICQKLHSQWQRVIEPPPAPESHTARFLLEWAFQQCLKLGGKRLYILVDSVDAVAHESPDKQYEYIAPLACDQNLLNLPGITFKFFLPLAMRKLFPHWLLEKHFDIQLKWRREELRSMLHERLYSCMEQADRTRTPLAELFDASCLEPFPGDERQWNYVEKFFVAIGERYQPRSMWRLGHLCLDLHLDALNSSPNSSPSGLISLTTLYRAYSEIQQEKVASVLDLLTPEQRQQVVDEINALIEAGEWTKVILRLQQIDSQPTPIAASTPAQQEQAPNLLTSERRQRILDEIYASIGSGELKSAILKLKELDPDEGTLLLFVFHDLENRYYTSQIDPQKYRDELIRLSRNVLNLARKSLDG